MKSHFHRAGDRNFADIESVEINGTSHRAEKKGPRDRCFVLSDPESRYFFAKPRDYNSRRLSIDRRILEGSLRTLVLRNHRLSFRVIRDSFSFFFFIDVVVYQEERGETRGTTLKFFFFSFLRQFHLADSSFIARVRFNLFDRRESRFCNT